MGRFKMKQSRSPFKKQYDSPNYGNRYLTSFLNENKSTVCFYTDSQDKIHISMTGIDMDEFNLISEVFISVPEIKDFFKEAIKAADEFSQSE